MCRRIPFLKFSKISARSKVDVLEYMEVLPTRHFVSHRSPTKPPSLAGSIMHCSIFLSCTTLVHWKFEQIPVFCGGSSLHVLMCSVKNVRFQLWQLPEIVQWEARTFINFILYFNFPCDDVWLDGGGASLKFGAQVVFVSFMCVLVLLTSTPWKLKTYSSFTFHTMYTMGETRGIMLHYPHPSATTRDTVT